MKQSFPAGSLLETLIKMTKLPSLPKNQRKTVEEFVSYLLKGLENGELQVIQLHYGLGDGHPYSEEEMMQILDMTKTQVLRILSRALKKLWKKLFTPPARIAPSPSPN